MNRLDLNTLTAHERMAEIALILARGVVRRQEKLKTKDMRDYSLDLEAAGSIHGQKRKEQNN
ncbi:MAG TPA: hypothetical protein DEA55_04965 [Rhodospirillaceae bacterium]|nr:hypothetical protein [Rhodospirillaceae bacterium]